LHHVQLGDAGVLGAARVPDDVREDIAPDAGELGVLLHEILNGPLAQPPTSERDEERRVIVAREEPLAVRQIALQSLGHYVVEGDGEILATLDPYLPEPPVLEVDLRQVEKDHLGKSQSAVEEDLKDGHVSGGIALG